MAESSEQHSPAAYNSDTPSRKDQRRAKLSPVLRFVLTFVVSLAVFGVLYAHLTASYHDQLLSLMEWTATLAGAFTSIFSDNVDYYGRVCSFRDFTVEIIDECTGLLEMVIYLAAVVSFSTTIRKKLLGLAFGIPAIYVFNLVRIVVLLVVGSFSQPAFGFMHLYFWQGTMIIMITSVWIGWLYLVVYHEKRPARVSP
ncbi:MAG: exosortase H [candidate division Zixibacteria bacterium]|nr:exosortase H [candidate division Zixibacteria bacterium]